MKKYFVLYFFLSVLPIITMAEDVLKGGMNKMEAVGNITFADTDVKALCVANWDTNGDGELSYNEASAVTGLGSVFQGNIMITTFNELEYFTGLTTINANAFAGCVRLTSVTIPNNVTTIEHNAFNGTKLASIDIPANVTTIGNAAFNWCSNLTSVSLHYGLTSIGHSAFANCTSLTNITIPSGITSIGNEVFVGCSNLTSVALPQSLSSIGEKAFKDCSKLNSIIIPNNVSYIGPAAFQYCI